MLLWAGLAISQLGDVIRFVALVTLIYEVTTSSLSVAGVLVSLTTPAFLLAPFTGVLIDRLPRRILLIASCGVRSVCSILIPVAVGQLEVVYAITFVSAVMAQFYTPVINSMLPDFVRPEELVQANSLIGFSFRIAQILGGAIAGMLLVSIWGYADILVRRSIFLGVCRHNLLFTNQKYL